MSMVVRELEAVVAVERVDAEELPRARENRPPKEDEDDEDDDDEDDEDADTTAVLVVVAVSSLCDVVLVSGSRNIHGAKMPCLL